MAELAALNVKIDGDASGLRAALQSAEDGLQDVSTQAQVTARQTAAVSGGMGRLGTAFTRNGFAISNAANQFSDLAVQMQMGVPATRALSQQLPQMTAFMGPLASVIGVASGVLIGLAGSFLSAAQEARTYQDALDDLDDITGSVNRASDVLNTSMFDLIARYGEAATRVRELAVAELELAVARQRGAVAQAMQNEELQSAIDEYGGLTRVVDMMGNTFYDTSDAARAIERDLGVTGQTAAELARGFNELQNAATVEEQVAAWQRIEALLDQAGISLSELPPELASALQTILALEGATIDLEAALNNAAAGAANLSRSLPQTTGGIGPGLFNADGSIAMPPGAPSEGGGGGVVGGGGGGGMSLADQLARDLEQLRQGFATQEELQLEAYARQQEILQQALEQRLLTQQEYAALMEQANAQHQDRMAAIDVYRYGSGVQQAQQFMGDMANALQNGNERMLRASKAFAAAEALISAWQAHNQTLRDPTLPWFAKIPAALSILSAGLGAVNAIKGVSMGGAGGSAGAAVSAGGGSAMAMAARPTQNVVIDMVNASPSQMSGIQTLVDMLTEANRQGYDLNAIVRGA